MKRLLKADSPPTEITTDKEKNTKNKFTYIDVVDILNQIEELSDYNVAMKIEDGSLLLAVGDSVYEISKVREERYPQRKLTKLET